MINGNCSSSYFFANINISLPVDVVHAAISLLNIGDVVAPN